VADTTTPGGTGDAAPIIFKALWDALNTVTGMVGLTVIQVLEVATVLVIALALRHLTRVFMRKTTWTLDPSKTPVAYVLHHADRGRGAEEPDRLELAEGAGADREGTLT
jgi:hypothetical protein